jgi:hypothetical protein
MPLTSEVSDQFLKQVCSSVVIHIMGKNVPGMCQNRVLKRIFIFMKEEVM